MCTKHPISNFISYAHLSKPIQCFVTNLSNTEVPNSIQVVLGNKVWSKAVFEEMRNYEHLNQIACGMLIQKAYRENDFWV